MKIGIGQFLRIMWKTPTVMLLMGAFTGVGFVALVLLSWMPKFLFDKFQLNLAMAGLVAIVTTMFATIYAMHKNKLQDLLKRELLDRGMSADEIVAVTRAKPTKSHADPNEI